MNKFKDNINRYITSGLFKETAQTPRFVIMTLEEAREKYVECNDPTGYLFAITHLDGWKHFLELKDSPTLSAHIESWEEELEVKLRSEAVSNMFKLADGDKGYQANKFLVDGGWKQKTAGRPTKAAVDRATNVKAKVYEEFNGSVDLKH